MIFNITGKGSCPTIIYPEKPTLYFDMVPKLYFRHTRILKICQNTYRHCAYYAACTLSFVFIMIEPEILTLVRNTFFVSSCYQWVMVSCSD